MGRAPGRQDVINEKYSPIYDFLRLYNRKCTGNVSLALRAMELRLRERGPVSAQYCSIDFMHVFGKAGFGDEQ